MAHKIQIKTTVLVLCEGETDTEFVRYLKHLYDRDRTKEIKIEYSKKSTRLKRMLHKLRNKCEVVGYDKAYIVIDSDKVKNPDKVEDTKENLYKTILGKNYKQLSFSDIIESDPCLEGMLLEIKGHNIKQSSEWCKDKFIEKYISSENADVYQYKVAYQKHFSKGILDKNMDHLWLKKLKNIFT